MSLNKVMLIGNVGKTPEIKNFDNGNKVAVFTLATTERYSDRNGDRHEQTEWHNVSVFGPLAEFVEKYVNVGRNIYVEGKLRTRSYETKSGERRYTTEIIASTVELLGKKESAPDDMPYYE